MEKVEDWKLKIPVLFIEMIYNFISDTDIGP